MIDKLLLLCQIATLFKTVNSVTLMEGKLKCDDEEPGTRIGFSVHGSMHSIWFIPV